MKEKARVKKVQAAQIAKMYYFEHKTQEEIARATNYSRANISRILNRCLQDGTAEIKIHDRMSQMPEAAFRIQRKWKLDDVYIAATSVDDDRTKRNIGELAAERLMSNLEDDMTLGTTAGRISYYTARSIVNTDSVRAHTVQLIGDMRAIYSVDSGQGLAAVFAQRLGGNCYVLQAPAFVKNTTTKNALLNSTVINTCYAKYASIDIALLEIEVSQLLSHTLPIQSCLSQADMSQLNEVGAVSSICGRYFDIDGYPCNANINERVIGISLSDLQRVPIKIGIAFGRSLATAVESCLNAHLLDVLIIDESLAKQIVPQEL